jgi:hypothetical protein
MANLIILLLKHPERNSIDVKYGQAVSHIPDSRGMGSGFFSSAGKREDIVGNVQSGIFAP